MKLFLVVNVDWFFLSHRLPIALEARRRGYDVTVMAIDTGRADEIRSYGLHFIPLPTDRRGLNPFRELGIIKLLYHYYKTQKPDVVHHVALKPVIYGSLAARLCRRIHFVNAISGMGYIFSNTEKETLLRKIVLRIFKIAFKNPSLEFIFQNNDDRNLIMGLGVIKETQAHIIEGSGIDLNEFKFVPESNPDVIRILYTGRLLRDKGIVELIEASRILKNKYGTKVSVLLAGDIDPENRASLTKSQVENWQDEGIIEWLGFQKDIFSLLASSHIVVLPSYREGLPKSLIEACAVGRPIVTTNVPGCRDVVTDGLNGLLVPVRDSASLAEALEKLIGNDSLRSEMGRQGRAVAERKFSIESVLNKTFAIYERKPGT
jgi:glycosyltransferase involved in cell wall biosynthesis